MSKKSLKVAIVGAGWAGLAAAVTAAQSGHQVTVFEAARTPGGRARTVQSRLPDGSSIDIDNGQHILIGAYRETLALMRSVGVSPESVLHREPLALCQPDGRGMVLPAWPSPLDAIAGIWSARGWSLGDRAAMTLAAIRWQWQNFSCPETTTVASLCAGLPPSVMRGFIEPLCVSALNTPTERASGQVFLTVLRDAMFGGKGSSNLLIPTADLTAIFPASATRWLQSQGATFMPAHRISEIQPEAPTDESHSSPWQWRVGDQSFDRVILALGPTETTRLLEKLAMHLADSPAQHPVSALDPRTLQQWLDLARNIRFESIATVYTLSPGAQLPRPMLALESDANHPAQFVFDRGLLGGPRGLWAFVVSASNASKETLQSQVLQQARRQLAADCFNATYSDRATRNRAGGPGFGRTFGLGASQPLDPVITIVEKKATFACTPGLIRPPHDLGNGLLACGDYLYGPYPATLEGAVRSGQLAAQGL